MQPCDWLVAGGSPITTTHINGIYQLPQEGTIYTINLLTHAVTLGGAHDGSGASSRSAGSFVTVGGRLAASSTA